jgi:mono/diheme cytochrome c family protein
MMLFTALLLMQAALPPQIQRGQVLFMDASKGCASCHALKGQGTAVGPDLKVAASLTPRAIVTMMRSTLTQYVQTVKLKTGEPFPAMPGAKDDKTIVLWDLSKMPPEQHKVDQAEIESMRNNETWKHPPLTRGYTPEEVADIIAYVKYAGAGERKKIDPDEVK